MKIFNAMFSKVNGGLEQVFLNYIPALSSQGNLVIPIIHPKAEIRNSCPQDHLITVHNFNQHDFFAIHRLKKLIKIHQPDCIITHSYRAAYLFKKTGTKTPKIAVCHVKGHYDFGTDAIIALTEQMRRDIINSGIEEHRVFTIPNLIHIPDDLQYREPKNNQIPTIGVCARFAAIKGVDVFINALAELKRRGVVFQAKIAGDGKEKEHYIELIRHHGLDHEISLLGWIEDKESFYKSIDIFCLPSREESFGLVVLESMMHSLPMVLTRLSGPLEIAGNSGCALFVPPEDPVSMADGLERLLRDKDLSKQLALKAFQRVQHYSSTKVAPMLHKVLEKICDTNQQ
ncbi:glycosyltransferase family 4 protein [Legionella pneumophila]|uniref:glycosyltransferase family 4 protein n=1 Tax=Legionella pneumophila TaxID=446 RepID=UPI00026D9DB0|nr:glycosyltransferase family 4 protein [Legionella pneumophila]CCD10278.1 CapM protein [Legionella pneumophila subsp. pneumophila]CZJ17457.1 GDP-mannose-dependent alpha-(1-2)-phosphatidylinositol mannosyltransferase [Legionella pneumophila]CZQ98323.1 GDP-mannose-dependent alpha-(1-2)-phosphatidylinositol mannosyltransferase [Legionella pneumophila]STX66034.1 CapM protein, capsular polysaccharide biosynthesis [Legionella pneumophila]HAT3870270.1 glycosyltransferase family 4 protein [Legionella